MFAFCEIGILYIVKEVGSSAGCCVLGRCGGARFLTSGTSSSASDSGVEGTDGVKEGC